MGANHTPDEAHHETHRATCEQAPGVGFVSPAVPRFYRKRPGAAALHLQVGGELERERRYGDEQADKHEIHGEERQCAQTDARDRDLWMLRLDDQHRHAGRRADQFYRAHLGDEDAELDAVEADAGDERQRDRNRVVYAVSSRTSTWSR
jgi:hypothetical protein